MKLKHSKYRNTGLLYELLVRQITSDLVAHRDSPAINILRKYFSGQSILVQEHKLYKAVVESTDVTSERANMLIEAAIRADKKLNQRSLREAKYNLVSEIKEKYDVEKFFSVPVPNYKALAAFYCLLEAINSEELIDPQFIVMNKTTLLESMTKKEQSTEDVTDKLIEEFSSSDRDLRLLTFKVLLEKFNKKYINLLPEQKEFLRQIISLGTSKGLKGYLKEELSKISSELDELSSKLPQGIERIKLNEVRKMIQPLAETEKLSDTDLVRALELYDLIAELKNLK